MNFNTVAGLGAIRAPGESALSWLRAGPLGARAIAAIAAEMPMASLAADDAGMGPAYCPRCWIEEGGRRRWYSREGWEDPRLVLCPVHAQVLVRSGTAPRRLRPWLFARQQTLLDQLRHWLSHWLANSPRWDEVASRRSCCLEDVILAALTDADCIDRQGCGAGALAQWMLWLEGYPVPATPKYHAGCALAHMPRQIDRFAAIVATHRISQALLAIGHPLSLRLPLSPAARDALARCCDNASIGVLADSFVPAGSVLRG